MKQTITSTRDETEEFTEKYLLFTWETLFPHSLSLLISSEVGTEPSPGLGERSGSLVFHILYTN